MTTFKIIKILFFLLALALSVVSVFWILILPLIVYRAEYTPGEPTDWRFWFFYFMAFIYFITSFSFFYSLESNIKSRKRWGLWLLFVTLLLFFLSFIFKDVESVILWSGLTMLMFVYPILPSFISGSFLGWSMSLIKSTRNKKRA